MASRIALVETMKFAEVITSGKKKIRYYTPSSTDLSEFTKPSDVVSASS
jgi:hypothetical protein